MCPSLSRWSNMFAPPATQRCLIHPSSWKQADFVHVSEQSKTFFICSQKPSQDLEVVCLEHGADGNRCITNIYIYTLRGPKQKYKDLDYRFEGTSSWRSWGSLLISSRVGNCRFGRYLEVVGRFWCVWKALEEERHHFTEWAFCWAVTIFLVYILLYSYLPDSDRQLDLWISACHPFFPTALALAKVVGQTGNVVLFEFFRANGCCFRTLEGSSKLSLHLSPSPLQLLDLLPVSCSCLEQMAVAAEKVPWRVPWTAL